MCALITNNKILFINYLLNFVAKHVAYTFEVLIIYVAGYCKLYNKDKEQITRVLGKQRVIHDSARHFTYVNYLDPTELQYGTLVTLI